MPTEAERVIEEKAGHIQVCLTHRTRLKTARVWECPRKQVTDIGSSQLTGAASGGAGLASLLSAPGLNPLLTLDQGPADRWCRQRGM